MDQNALDKITFVVLESQLKLALYEQVFEGRVTLMPCIVTISKFFLIDLVSVLSTTFLNNSRFVLLQSFLIQEMQNFPRRDPHAERGLHGVI